MAKKRIPFISFTVDKLEDFETIEKTPFTKKVIFDRLVESVLDGIKKNKKEVTIFKIHNTDELLNLDKTKWKDSLLNAIEFYKEREEFEKCSECIRLIDQIK